MGLTGHLPEHEPGLAEPNSHQRVRAVTELGDIDASLNEHYQTRDH